MQMFLTKLVENWFIKLLLLLTLGGVFYSLYTDINERVDNLDRNIRGIFVLSGIIHLLDDGRFQVLPVRETKDNAEFVREIREQLDGI